MLQKIWPQFVETKERPSLLISITVSKQTGQEISFEDAAESADEGPATPADVEATMDADGPARGAAAAAEVPEDVVEIVATEPEDDDEGNGGRVDVETAAGESEDSTRLASCVIATNN